MPRKGPVRPQLWIRLHPDRITAVDAAAQTAGVKRPVWLRRAIAFALNHMPADYQPHDHDQYPDT